MVLLLLITINSSNVVALPENGSSTTVFDEVTAALARGDRVELRGFGAFSAKKRGARQGRNPRTGAAVQVSEKLIPYFKTGKQLREKLNAKG